MSEKITEVTVTELENAINETETAVEAVTEKKVHPVIDMPETKSDAEIIKAYYATKQANGDNADFLQRLGVSHEALPTEDVDGNPLSQEEYAYAWNKLRQNHLNKVGNPNTAICKALFAQIQQTKDPQKKAAIQKVYDVLKEKLRESRRPKADLVNELDDFLSDLIGEVE